MDPSQPPEIPHRRRLALAAGLVVALTAHWMETAAAEPARQTPSAAAPSASAPAAVRVPPAAAAEKLLADLRKSSLNSDQRREIVGQIIALGPDAARRLAVQTARDVDTRSAAYLARFEKAAADALRKKATKLAPGQTGQGATASIDAEIQSLRKTVSDVSHSGNLTKELIIEKADPALARLIELLSIDRDAVLEAEPDLKDRRAEIVDLANAYQMALEQTPADHRKGIAVLPGTEEIEKELARRENLAATLATPMSKADREILATNVALAARLDPEEAAGILDLNAIRVRLGIGALSIDPKLCEAARGHSKDMVEKKFFDHASPVPGKETPWKRAALVGTSASAENIYAGSSSGVAAIETWWHSPGHHKNMTSDARRVGLGRCQSDFTQMFGR